MSELYIIVNYIYVNYAYIYLYYVVRYAAAASFAARAAALAAFSAAFFSAAALIFAAFLSADLEPSVGASCCILSLRIRNQSSLFGAPIAHPSSFSYFHSRKLISPKRSTMTVEAEVRPNLSEPFYTQKVSHNYPCKCILH